MTRLDEADVRQAYSRWAPVYDVSFGWISSPGRRMAIERLNRQGNIRILEVGVGTGLSLDRYTKASAVIGIDLSAHMIARAKRAITRAGASHASLCLMDAAQMGFPDGAFDAVAAMYVMTVVPDAAKVMQEVVRVLKPGGEAIIVNHFSQSHGVRGAAERGLARFSRHLGWHPVFPVENVLVRELKLIERVDIAPFGLFTLLRFKKEA